MLKSANPAKMDAELFATPMIHAFEMYGEDDGLFEA